MNAEKKSGRGGARAGAGPRRETGTGEQIRKNFLIDQVTIEVLKEVGDGNSSEGLRRLAYDYLSRKNKITL